MNARLYHSGALLLPDATVLIAGGGAPGPLVNLNAEIYYPPYLFDEHRRASRRGRASSRRRTPSSPARPFTVGIGERAAASAASRSSRPARRPTASTWISASSSCRSRPSGAMLDVQLPTRAGRRAARLLHAVRARRPGRALGRAHGARRHHGDRASRRPTSRRRSAARAAGRSSSSCEAGEVLVGVRGSTATYVQQVGPLCVNVNQSGQWIGSPVERGITGSAGTTAYAKMCPVNSADQRLPRPLEPVRQSARFRMPHADVERQAHGHRHVPRRRRARNTGTAAGPVSLRQRRIRRSRSTAARAAGWTASACSAARRPRRSSTRRRASRIPGGQSSTHRRGRRPARQRFRCGRQHAHVQCHRPAAGSRRRIRATGRITGTPTTLGDYAVALTASRRHGHRDRELLLGRHASSRPSRSSPLPQLSAARTSALPVTYTASSANGTNVQYKWFFDDGTPTTDYSSSATISHTFAQPGVYYVTVTALSDGSPAQSETVTQTIHLPLTANRPTASATSPTRIAPAGNRVWVVNQDNDSVTVFNAATNAKVAEITVGIGPAHAGGRAQRPRLGDQQVRRHDQRHRPGFAGVSCRRSRCRSRRSRSALRSRRPAGWRSSRSKRRGRLLKLDAATRRRARHGSTSARIRVTSR